MNSSATERFERAYRRLWMALHRPDEADLTQHELQLLHHVPVAGGIPLTALARHLALPKSTASVLVKDLERRGFLHRARDASDERRLAIALTDAGRRRVEADSVLSPEHLSAALALLQPATRRALLDGVEQLASASERVGRATPGLTARVADPSGSFGRVKAAARTVDSPPLQSAPSWAMARLAVTERMFER